MLIKFQIIFTLILIITNYLINCFKFIDLNWNLTFYIRLLGPIVLFSNFDPVISMIILECVLDTIEPNINRGNIQYHTRDKLLDMWGWTVSILWLWTDTSNESLNHSRIFLTTLYFIRCIGNILFIMTNDRKWLARFPNMYSTLFVLIPLINILITYNFLSSKYGHYLLYLLIVVKIIVEQIHHGQTVNKLKKFRKYVKCICPGKYEMYLKTGTYPVDKTTINVDAPLLKY